MEIILFVVWCVLMAVWANALGRRWWVWLLISLFLTPLVAMICLIGISVARASKKTSSQKTGASVAALAARLGLKPVPDSFLAKALSELDEHREDKLVWASAISKASGKHDRARALYIRIRGQILADAAEEERLTQERARLATERRTGNYTCPNCGHLGVPEKVARGNPLLCALLLLLFIVPGVLYGLVYGGYKGVCFNCGHTIIPRTK